MYVVYACTQVQLLHVQSAADALAPADLPPAGVLLLEDS